MLRVFNALDHLLGPEFSSAETSWTPLWFGLLCFVAAILFYCFGSGLWRLKNWARVLALVFTLTDLVLGGLPDVMGPLKLVIPLDPVTSLAGRFASFVLVLYLLSSQVRASFGIREPLMKWTVTAVSVLALASLAYTLSKSGPELQALRWHMRHGDRVNVNGVSFPVYTWWVPVQENDGADLRIKERPGPLRGKDQIAFIEVKGTKDNNSTLGIEQLVDQKVREDEKAGYIDLKKFQLQVGKQTLGCMQNAFYFNAIYCYGDGPIYSVFFTGGNRSLGRFKRMMAEAR